MWLIGGPIAAATLLAVAGWIPTMRLFPVGGIGAMLTGIGASLVAALAAAAPIALLNDRSPMGRHTAMMTAMAVRMVLTLTFLGGMLAVGWGPRVPLAVWTGVSYMVLLAVETVVFVKISQHREQKAA